MMNCIIVDDEAPARQLLKSYTDKIPYLKVVGIYKNGKEALNGIEGEAIDLVITDIEMPDLLGTELVSALPPKTMVIFTTAYQEYALKGFELKAIDYLLKPFSFERFMEAIRHGKELHGLRELEHTEKPQFKAEYLTVKADHKLYKVLYSDIKYIEGMREYVSFHVQEGRITALLSLKSLEDALPSEQFIRCHKSYIVNKNKVSALESGGLVIEKKVIPIGQSYRERVVEEVF
jgi:DNA-binding LytR/AlgR family response regulator